MTPYANMLGGREMPASHRWLSSGHTHTRDRSLVDSSNLHDGEHMHTRDVKNLGVGIRSLRPLFA